MMEDTSIPKLNQVHALWQNLTYELTDIYDAHGVCAAVAQVIAQQMKVMTVVGVQDPQRKYYDVWICNSNGRTDQFRWSNKKAAFSTLIHAGKAMHTDKFSRPPAELINSELWQLPSEEILSVPIPFPVGNNPMTQAPPGLLCLIDPVDCPLNERNLEPLAANITTFLDRAALRLQVDRQTIEFAILSDINYALGSKLSLQNIFKQLMDPVRRTLNVESVSMGLIDAVTGDITFVDILMGPLFQNLPPVRLKKGQGIAGWVAERGQSIIVNDVYSDERFFSRIDTQSGFQTHSMICIPLQVEERMIGVLQAINKQEGDFIQHDLYLLQAIAGPLAAAIENARLHDDVIAEKRRIETIFANMSEGLLTVSGQGVITQANDALLTLLAVPEAAEVVDRPVDEVIRLQKGSLTKFMDELVAVEDDYLQLATELHLTNGEIAFVPVLISGASIIDEIGQVVETILVFSDLRQIREVERIRDDFFHGIVHELRTPLATILMYARMLRGGKAQDKEKADRFLGVIERESDRLQKMVRQMLRLAKMEARELQRSSGPVLLNPMFAEMLPPLADRATEKGLTFRQKIQPDLPSVMGDQETFYLIFKNLVDNAIKFTLSGAVRVDAWSEAGMVYVNVQDEGIGIPQLALPNLFKRFYRTQTAVERGIAGTGLGLYMVKESVENYNGTIDVTSVEGKGTTFTVSLPAAIL